MNENPLSSGFHPQEMPQKSHIKVACACKAEVACNALHPEGARPPVEVSDHYEVDEVQLQSRGKVNHSFCSFAPFSLLTGFCLS